MLIVLIFFIEWCQTALTARVWKCRAVRNIIVLPFDDPLGHVYGYRPGCWFLECEIIETMGLGKLFSVVDYIACAFCVRAGVLHCHHRYRDLTLNGFSAIFVINIECQAY